MNMSGRESGGENEEDKHDFFFLVGIGGKKD